MLQQQGRSALYPAFAGRSPLIGPETEEDGAYHIAEALRRSIRSLAIPHEASPCGVVTVSIGLAMSRRSDSITTAEGLMARADRALYDAKAAGRDRVMGWRDRMDVQHSQGAA